MEESCVLGDSVQNGVVLKNAYTTLLTILDNVNLVESGLRYCLCDDKKVPFKIDGKPARPNIDEDFVDIFGLADCDKLNNYAGIGVSIQSSKICAIDVDGCFSVPFDLSSADKRATDIIKRFGEVAYIEFSFSGKGLRVLFRHAVIDNYSDLFYIKNSKIGIEYYQPSNSYRYVTITGRTICDNPVAENDKLDSILHTFLIDYMLRPVVAGNHVEVVDDTDIDILFERVKTLYRLNHVFLELWFSKAPSFGHDESERDFTILSFLYQHITKDRDKLKVLFESSPFFQSKDYAHKKKWERNNNWYLDYMYRRLTF